MMLKDDAAYELTHLLEGWECGVSRSVNCAWLPWSRKAEDHCSFLWVCVETFLYLANLLWYYSPQG